MADHRSLSLWHDTLPADDTMQPRAGLASSTDVDIAIVGAGFTGLWTAHYLIEADPSLRIVVLERDVAGFGASGRNGGWASSILPMSLDRIAAEHGRDEAIRMQRTMYASVDEVGRAAAELGIECHFAKGGQLDFVRSAPQAQRARAHIGHLRAFGLDDVRWLDPDEATERAAASDLLGAVHDPHCAAIHPARLVRGLAASVERRGVEIYEQTTVSAIEPGAVVTDHGRVRADIVVRATEGFTPSLAGLKRAIAPIYSLMIATEPLPDSLWSEIGLSHRDTFADGRHSIIYGQRTADGRFAFGGRGAPYHFASAIKPEFDRDDKVHAMLHTTLRELFPQIGDAAITHRWGGALGMPRDWYCGVGLDAATGMAWAGGYVGDGVTTTNLAGRTLADLILRRDTELTTLPWVGHRSRNWEPEPIRWMAIRSALKLPAAADRYEARTGKNERARTWILGKLLGR